MPPVCGYRPAPDTISALRETIKTLAHRHRRYGGRNDLFKLRQAGEIVNHKRVDRLYAVEKLQLTRRNARRLPVTDRQPLLRPDTANEVWSMDFVFDRSADGRVGVKSLAIVDDATHRGGHHPARAGDQRHDGHPHSDELALPVDCRR